MKTNKKSPANTTCRRPSKSNSKSTEASNGKTQQNRQMRNVRAEHSPTVRFHSHYAASSHDRNNYVRGHTEGLTLGLLRNRTGKAGKEAAGPSHPHRQIAVGTLKENGRRKLHLAERQARRSARSLGSYPLGMREHERRRLVTHDSTSESRQRHKDGHRIGRKVGILLSPCPENKSPSHLMLATATQVQTKKEVAPNSPSPPRPLPHPPRMNPLAIHGQQQHA